MLDLNWSYDRCLVLQRIQMAELNAQPQTYKRGQKFPLSQSDKMLWPRFFFVCSLSCFFVQQFEDQIEVILCFCVWVDTKPAPTEKFEPTWTNLWNGAWTSALLICSFSSSLKEAMIRSSVSCISETPNLRSTSSTVFRRQMAATERWTWKPTSKIRVRVKSRSKSFQKMAFFQMKGREGEK